LECLTTLASKLSHAKRRKILLAPEQARHGRNSIVLEHPLGGIFSNELPAQFLECRRIFAWKNCSCGITAMFEGGISFVDSG
jgi:hypothetical protein